MAVQLNIEAAMTRLLSFGLVSRAGDADAYEVATLAQATRRLGTAWGNLRTASNAARDDPAGRGGRSHPTLELLTTFEPFPRE